MRPKLNKRILILMGAFLCLHCAGRTSDSPNEIVKPEDHAAKDQNKQMISFTLSDQIENPSQESDQNTNSDAVIDKNFSSHTGYVFCTVNPSGYFHLYAGNKAQGATEWMNLLVPNVTETGVTAVTITNTDSPLDSFNSGSSIKTANDNLKSGSGTVCTHKLTFDGQHIGGTFQCKSLVNLNSSNLWVSKGSYSCDISR